ncbi:hypothetical protein BC835DRAFT_1286300, partial [Cytidiella melzeri]
GTADAPGDAVGMALDLSNSSAMTGKPGLGKLYLPPAFRNQGIRKALVASRRRETHPNLRCRVGLRASQRNSAIQSHDKVLGATSTPKWVGMRLKEEGIQNLKKYAIQSSECVNPGGESAVQRLTSAKSNVAVRLR